MKHLLNIIKKHKFMVYLYISSGILLAFLNNFSANYFQIIIDRFNNKNLSMKNIIVYATILLLLCILNYLDEYPGKSLEQSIYLDLKILALKKINLIDYKEYKHLGTGKLVQRVENGAFAGKGILFNFWFSLYRELIPSILFSMIFIYNINKKIMFSIFSGYIIIFIVTNLLLKSLYFIKEKILINEEKMSHFLVRGFMEMVVFRVNRRFSSEINKVSDSKKEIVNAKIKMNMIHEAFFTIFALLITIVKVTILCYGWFSKSLTIGEIVALITLVDNAYTPIAIFNVLFVEYKLDSVSFDKYEEFLNIKEDEQLYNGLPIKNLSGNIEFDSVDFSYEARNIIRKLSLNIKYGEKIALVGESGSGKSTIVSLLIGLLKPEKGKILVNGYNLSELCLDSYYKHISYISQESPVFDGSLRENLVFDKPVTNKEIVEVLKKVNLFTLYEKLDNGLDTQLGERGVSLSGGERQRLALGRLWFDNSDLIILDEATSAMDNITEDLVINNVLKNLNGKTIIVIAHRLETIRDFNRIIVFKDGAIYGDGDFKTLNTKNDYFIELYNKSLENI